ncbi:deoxyribose-phosphate aldolase [Methanocella arvoryzae]|uniref:Deoxyribose-phosphate aldolase n=1 Tax=Methanocella arvoryzae (strain DSM 22066 / NBRC 105507 / MRE50) TaxID=351160 RepID=DEOC_METAR|nr:deoxyribose-phosphate aldolase [Methanocella arvoryzae]Q0W6M2.1 RecName: Full=Deoxyribose-phosphate aldolase; Short=DERA; AltName: Full=2-deoxy-D-ribose 5-phosphate aldolase; AltName: Full=Phosphodeoxyriboaldolase; Short=Deoxyriboaldolase [Methanocella arvoryzae MRE50]CAJ35971.1 deoxyribose-phosphate aldolase [Methanocella arvoryzae MRE50]
MENRDIARLIDHTLLRPDATQEDIEKLCAEAVEYGFASVCTATCWTSFVREYLDAHNSPVKVCSVVGFPFGSALTDAKREETWDAVEYGADEIDMVINVGYLRSGMLDLFEKDIRTVVKVSGSAAVKVIIETCYLTDEQKVLAARTAKKCGAAFVKTSTGYGPSGARLEDVRLIREAVPDILIKASGGIRTYEQAKAFTEAGASRIGTSSGIAIVTGARGESSY